MAPSLPGPAKAALPVALAGSRSLPAGAGTLVAQVARALARAGRPLVVGCCVGADAAVLAAVPGPQLSVFAAFGPGGQGACQLSAVAGVARAVSAGAQVHWWAGGPISAPLRARLARRSRAVLAAGPGGLVVFPAAPSSRGSWAVAQLAANSGLPLAVFPCGFPPGGLPVLGPGQWLPAAGSGLWAGAWRWTPDPGLF